MSVPIRIWNFNDVKQARQYLNRGHETYSKDGKMLKAEFVTLASGRDLYFKDMTDDEAMYYAAELAKIFGVTQL